MNRALLSWNQITLFPGQFWLGLLYPTVGFALWHLAPMSIFTYKGPVSEARWWLRHGSSDY
jgi:hypothetical protein